MRASDRGRVGEGVGKITYPRDKTPLLCNQVVSHPHPTLMVTLNTFLDPSTTIHDMQWVYE
jgi:hypothetical protein